MPNSTRILSPFPLAPPLAPDRIQSDFEAQFRRDAIGHKLHVAFGMLWCFLLSWPTSMIELAQLPLIAYALLRLTNTHRMINSWALQPLVLLLALFAVWQAMSLAWTPDRTQGLDDLSVMRWAWAAWALWPVMDRRRWFIIALAAGYIVGMGMQILQASGFTLGTDFFRFNRPPGRISGWWDPAVGGSLLVAALGLHLPVAIMGKGAGRARIAALVGTLATLIAILATGTRGAWIAAAASILTVLAIAAFRIRPRRRLIPLAVFALAGCVLLAIGAWSAAGKSVKDRALEAKRELVAVAQGDFSSFTGGRVLMAREAVHLFAQHPLHGVGIGGFEAAARAHLESTEPGATQEKYKDRIHAHAHNTLLHIGATTGIVGLAFAIAIGVVALRGAADSRWLPRGAPATYDAAPLGALIALVWISLFDTLHVNSQTAALLATLLGLCLLNPPHAKAA